MNKVLSIAIKTMFYSSYSALVMMGICSAYWMIFNSNFPYYFIDIIIMFIAVFDILYIFLGSIFIGYFCVNYDGKYKK